MTEEIINWENTLLPSITNLIDEIANELKPEDVFYDIGANTGLLSLKIMEKCPNVTYYLFEPVSKYYDACIEKFDKHVNVIVFNYAVMHRTEEMHISMDGGNKGYNTLSFIRDYGEKEKIQAKTLYDIGSSNLMPFADVIKIDVEQAESFTIAGMKEYFKRGKSPRKIFMEVGVVKNHPLWEKEVEMFEYLFSIGYKRFDYNFTCTTDVVFELEK